MLRACLVPQCARMPLCVLYDARLSRGSGMKERCAHVAAGRLCQPAPDVCDGLGGGMQGLCSAASGGVGFCRAWWRVHMAAVLLPACMLMVNWPLIPLRRWHAWIACYVCASAQKGWPIHTRFCVCHDCPAGR